MKDEQCVRFLQWALPRLQMRWPGFRKVRRQVCKRVARRMRALGLADIESYKAYLQEHVDEWTHLDGMCRITISRFCRDEAVFSTLTRQVFPLLVAAARNRGDRALRIWSAGCGSGEEPFTLAALWRLEMRPLYAEMTIDIVATDIDPHLIDRALDARYAFGSVKDVPENLRDRIFTRENDLYTLSPEYRRDITFRAQDIRRAQPDGLFDLVLCRNLVFTYYDDGLQRQLLDRIISLMHDGAALVVGAHEQLPEGMQKLAPLSDKQPIYRKTRGLRPSRRERS